MSLPVNFLLNVRAAVDSSFLSEKASLFVDDVVLDTTFTKYTCGRLTIAAGAVAVPFSFSAVTDAKLVLVSSLGELAMQVNSSGAPSMTLKSYTNSEGVVLPGFLAFLGSGVTALYFSNATAAAVDVDVSVIA